jgi:hypothetical protein
LSLDRHARISGDNIGRSREINFRDSRPWAAGLPILEVDPVASEAVKVLLPLEILLPLVEVLLSAVPPDADLWGALTVQKTPVRVEAAADIVQTSAAPGVLGEEKIPVRGWWERRIMGIARGGQGGGGGGGTTGTQPTNNQNDIPIATASVDRADVRLMLRCEAMIGSRTRHNR